MQHAHKPFMSSAGKIRPLLAIVIFVAGLAAGGYLVRQMSKPGERPRAVAFEASDRGDSGRSAIVAPAHALASEDAAPRPAADFGAAETGLATEASRRTGVVQAAEMVGPAVVSISVTQVRLVRDNLIGGSLDPFDRYLSQFFPSFRRQEVSSIGSGVIIDERGIVVTNEHVVRNAREIKVSLPDGRTFDATLIGADPGYDLGVLRIEAEDLPVARVGDSDQLIVGEWAIALGNPFGFLLKDYQPTVTAGVISAMNRDIKPDDEGHAVYKNMIQTDAAINPGNSGGPLVNGVGEVIGINTFIFSTGGGSLGIGFAMPINTVIRVVREILEYGHVRQVWIGISVREIDQILANYYRIRDRHGLVVWGLEDGSPAATAGIQVGDIIRKVDGQPVSHVSEARRLIFGATIGDQLRMEMERDGELQEVVLHLVEASPDR